MTPVQSEADLPAVFSTLLARLRLEVVDIVADSTARITPVAFQARAFSNVMRLRISNGDGATLTHWFAKIQTPKPVPDAAAHMARRVRHEFETTRQVEAALAGQPGMEALHAVACYPELFAIVTQELKGVTLLAYLETRLTRWRSRSAQAEAERAVNQVGAWLRRFQGIGQVPDVLSRTELRDYIDLRLERLASSRRSSMTARLRARVLEHIDHLLRAVVHGDMRSVMRHADLAPGNVMVTANGIGVLDFAMTSRGTYLHDLTRLSLQLDLMRGKPYYSPRAIEDVKLALRRGFDPAVAPTLPLFRVLTLLHRINHLGTLTLAPPRGLARLYAGHLRRMHERGIEREIQTPIDA